MKKILALTLLGLLAAGSLSCTDEDKIAAAFQDGIEFEPGPSTPIDLGQNYPNPFNPSTTINFAVAIKMHITLKVLTEDWQEVATLVDGITEVGYYRVAFNSGELPSGEYYYTLEGSGITLVRRMRILK
jgi:hypothetical protein